MRNYLPKLNTTERKRVRVSVGLSSSCWNLFGIAIGRAGMDERHFSRREKRDDVRLKI